MMAATFHKPATVDDAVRVLSDAGEGGRPISGGATLVAMMNAKLVEPDVLVSLSAIAELKDFGRAPDGTVRIGAMRRHRETAFESDLSGGQAVVAKAASQIANPPVRNMGTIGGSISFADPAADYPPALVAADATIEIAGPDGRRLVPAEEFFLGWYETAVEPGEIVTAVLLPPAPERAVGHYEKLCRVAGDFALASVALVLALDGDGTVTHLRLAVGGCGGGPVRCPEAEALVVGAAPSAERIAALAERLVEDLDPVDDSRGSAEYRLQIVPRLIAKAFEEALTEMEPAR